MHGWTVRQFGHYRRELSWEEQPDPAAEGSAAVIDVKAAGVMFADLLNISGMYQIKAPLPFVPGSEAAGVVIERGPDCPYQVGDRVVTVNLIGGFAEKALALEQGTYALPAAMSFADAACFCINYQTAYFALVHRGRLREGETVLVHAGSSGVGIAAAQIAKALNATVIATASNAEKLEVCRRAGADHVINYQEQDFVPLVKELTGGRGADIIYDPVGGDVFDKSSKCINLEGRILVIGFASGRIPQIAANRLLLKNIDVIGFFLGSYTLNRRDLVREVHARLYEMYEAGQIKPIIYKEYAFDQLPEALEAIESRVCWGKPVLVRP